MEYKKTYKGLILWLIAFMFGLPGLAALPFRDSEILAKVILNVCALFIVLLAYMIYRTEAVYWYNGTSYEDALLAGSERRKAFARRHLGCFGRFAVCFLLYSLVSEVCHLHMMIDTLVFTVGCIGAAVATIPYKL